MLSIVAVETQSDVLFLSPVQSLGAFSPRFEQHPPLQKPPASFSRRPEAVKARKASVRPFLLPYHKLGLSSSRFSRVQIFRLSWRFVLAPVTSEGKSEMVSQFGQVLYEHLMLFIANGFKHGFRKTIQYQVCIYCGRHNDDFQFIFSFRRKLFDKIE